MYICAAVGTTLELREQNSAEDSKILENKPKLKPYHPHWQGFSAIENVVFRHLELRRVHGPGVNETPRQ